MNQTIYVLNLEQAWMIAAMVKQLPLADMLEAINHAESIGIIIDPTLLRQNISKMEEDKEILKSLLVVQKKLNSMKATKA